MSTTRRNTRRLTEYAEAAVAERPSTLAADDTVEAPEAPEVIAPKLARWEGTIGMETLATGDGRLIENEALTWETPAPLRFVDKDVGYHDGATDVGTIEVIERRDGGVIFARGTFDLEEPAGRQAYRRVRKGTTNGVSMDLDDVDFEIRVAAEMFESVGTPEEAAEGDEPELETDEDGRVIVHRSEADSELMVTTHARIRGATIVSIPAFSDARIEVIEDIELPDEADDVAILDAAEELVAAAAPVAPPTDWFKDPKLTGPTPLTIDDDGRIYGHLATWDVCHTANPAGPGTCTVAPSSATDYGYFHTGAIITREGDEIAVGRITMDTGHAASRAAAMAAAAHYDNTGSAVADIRAGEDAYGVWVAGAMRPDVSDEKRRALRSSPLSGDWRTLAGNLELVAALAVNVPGFPVPRPAGLAASGRLESLVAAGMVPPRQVAAPGTPGALSDDDLRYLKRLAMREREAERDEFREAREQLAQRVRDSAARVKVMQFVNKRKG